MPMYHSPIAIKRTPQMVRFHKEIELPKGLLTLELLSKYVGKDETFAITEREEDRFCSKNILHIYGTRLETPEEVSSRVAKEEKYMENYKKFHEKYKK